VNPIYYRILQFGGAFATVVGVSTMIGNDSVASGVTRWVGVLGIYLGTVLSRPERQPQEGSIARVRILVGTAVFAVLGSRAFGREEQRLSNAHAGASGAHARFGGGECATPSLVAVSVGAVSAVRLTPTGANSCPSSPPRTARRSSTRIGTAITLTRSTALVAFTSRVPSCSGFWSPQQRQNPLLRGHLRGWLAVSGHRLVNDQG
jgi:hypothetical protein